jgi:hypothetical protein
VNADEVHTGSSAVETGWCYRAIYPTPEMIQEVSQDFFMKQVLCRGFRKLWFMMKD